MTRDEMIALNTRIASIADSDEQLDYWAAHSLIWGEPAPYLVTYASWLREGGPERWHEAAQHWNWDYGMVPLRWIVMRPQCEAATALEVFYLGQPEYLERIDKDEESLLALIRQRWAAGAFATGGIAFTYPRGYPPNRYLDGVPLSMRVSLPGKTIAKHRRGFADGFPTFLLS